MNLAINICIIAHVDHGKTTLFNSIINFCKKSYFYKKKFFFKSNYLYTIKCSFFSSFINNNIINFIDCPGHFDFVNEIYKSINFSNYCYILLDLLKGVEPQTLFCYNVSKKFNKKIIIFINKIDFFFNLKNLKNKMIFFDKNLKIFFISSKYNIGLSNLFHYYNFIYIKKNKIIFILEFLNSIKYNNIIIVKIIQGCITIYDTLKNKFNNFIKILKIGIFSLKNFFLKKTIFNCIHFLIINNNISNKSLFFFSKKNIFFFEKINTIIYYNLYLINNFYFIKLIKNDFSLSFIKNNSDIFGEFYLIGFIGILHSEIFFKKLKILSIFWVTNIIILFLFNKKNFWYIDFYNKYNYNEYEQIVLVNIYILKKNFYVIIQNIFNYNYYKINILKFENMLIINFYINLYKIINNFFYNLSKKINGFIFYEFKFHHFLKSNLFFLKISINNKLINEFNLIIDKNNIDKCYLFFDKIKKNIKINNDINIKFIYKKKIYLRKKIFSYKKNVLEKCYGGDITRKMKLINNQKKKRLFKKNDEFYLDKNIIINILKNELSNI